MMSSSVFARPQKCGRALLVVGLFALITYPATAQLPARPALDPAKELAAIRAASTLDSDPADSRAVQQVCTVCHSSSQFLGTPRSSGRWEQVYGQMAQQGAHPTDEQIDQIVRYFQRNLTVVNVNTSPLEELEPTLQIGPDASTAILMRRGQRKFSGIADLAAVPGVDRSVLEQLKDRLQF
ncbi:MAG: helix-hairpin-helix domain-containing protein [Rhizomicrobium sp.]